MEGTWGVTSVSPLFEGFSISGRKVSLFERIWLKENHR